MSETKLFDETEFVEQVVTCRDKQVAAIPCFTSLKNQRENSLRRKINIRSKKFLKDF